MPCPELVATEKGKLRSGDPGLGFTLFRLLPPVAPCRHSKASVILVGRLWGVCRHGRSRVLRRLHVQVQRASVRAVGARRDLHQRIHSGNKRGMPLQEPTKE